MDEERSPIDLNALALPELWAVLSADGRVRRLLELARDEDIGPAPGAAGEGDATSRAAGRGERDEVTARVVLRKPGRVAGVAAVGELLDVYGAEGLRVIETREDGSALEAGEAALTLRGPRGWMTTVERPLLNLLGRLSGVATLTEAYVRAMRSGAGATDEPVTAGLYDTRKTTPGLRAFEKYAVRCGGGRLHRYSLADAVMLKDNHLAGLSDDELPGFVERVAARARAERALRFVQVEVDRLSQLAALLVLPAGVVDIVLLDNMAVEELREAAAMRDAAGGRLELEASGGVTLETIAAIARAGVDRVSVGALTHQARSLDVGLDIAG